MTKIVYDHQVFGWQRYGGVSRYIYEIASHLHQSEDLDVKILAIAYANEYLKNCKTNLVVGVPIPYIPKYRIQKIIGRFNDQISKIWLNNNYPDIIHKTYYYSQNLIPKGAKVVITVHDMIHEKFSQFFNHPNIFKLKDDTSLAKKRSIEQADYIICVSENTKKDLIEILNVNPNKISVIYSGCSLNTDLLSQSNMTPPEFPYIFYVGDRGTYKNFQGLLQAYANSSQLRNNFKILCFGNNDFSISELSQIRALGLTKDQVVYRSGNDTVLANLYSHASVFVCPSLYEGFGLTLLESMSLHCPIACSKTSSLPEVVGNAAELFNPAVPESITEALEKVLFSSDRAINLVNLGTERIKHFSWENCAKETKQLYLSLL